MRFHSLVPFTPCESLQVEAAVVRASSSLQFTYHLKGALDPLGLVSSAILGQRRDELWRSTCFEAFFGFADAANYWELNIAPSGDWNFYSFADYRRGMRRDERVVIDSFSSRFSRPGIYTTQLSLNLEPLLADSPTRHFELSLNAVIAHPHTGLGYWALRHSGKVPDFHQRQSFVHCS